MADFPALIPSSRTHDAGVFAFDRRTDLSGAEVRFLRSSVATRHTLELVFDQLTAAEARSVLDFYASVKGSADSFTITAGTWCSDYAPSDLLWHFVGTPTLADLTPNSWSCTLQMESVTSSTPRVATGLPKASVTTSLLVTTAPLSPLVAQGVVIGEGHGAVTVSSSGTLRLGDRQFRGTPTVGVVAPAPFVFDRPLNPVAGTVEISNTISPDPYLLNPADQGGLIFGGGTPPASLALSIDVEAIDLSPVVVSEIEPDRHIPSRSTASTDPVGTVAPNLTAVEWTGYQSSPHFTGDLPAGVGTPQIVDVVPALPDLTAVEWTDYAPDAHGSSVAAFSPTEVDVPLLAISAVEWTDYNQNQHEFLQVIPDGSVTIVVPSIALTAGGEATHTP